MLIEGGKVLADVGEVLIKWGEGLVNGGKMLSDEGVIKRIVVHVVKFVGFLRVVH